VSDDLFRVVLLIKKRPQVLDDLFAVSVAVHDDVLAQVGLLENPEELVLKDRGVLHYFLAKEA
jgi:hypothetical protein